MRNKIVAANWKMNLMPAEGAVLISDVVAQCNDLKENQHVIFAVPFTHLAAAQQQLSTINNAKVHLAAQNCHTQASGAFTGEISIGMLQSFGVQYILVGHSERRIYNHESNALLKEKVDAILAAQLTPIFCCGEPLEVREANTQNQFVQQQFEESIMHLTADQIQNIVIAYEPIWAIGTGKTASTEQAQLMHAHLRKVLSDKYGDDVADNISILYGGSCNASNANDLFAQKDIDGGLIGGAALKADTFLPIINAMK